MKRIICSACLIGLFLIFAISHPVTAQEKSVVMPNRTGEISIRPDGKVDVCETWMVQFVGGPFKYARRMIPLNKVEEIGGWRISENGQSYQLAKTGAPNTYQISEEDDQQIAIWYFPPTTDQTRSFEVCYTLIGALRIGETQDEFYWKFIEPDRSYPVENVQVRLRLPESFPANELEVATYLNGKQKDGAQVQDGATVNFSGGPIQPNQDWELRVRFPAGGINAAPPAWQTGSTSNASPETPLTITGVIFGLGLLAMVTLIVLILIFGHKYHANRKNIYQSIPRRGRKSPETEPESAFIKIMGRLYGWPLIVLGLLIFLGGAILGTTLGLPLFLVFSAIGVGMLTFLAGGITQNQRSDMGGRFWFSGDRGDWGGGGGGGDSGGGGGGGGSDFG